MYKTKVSSEEKIKAVEAYLGGLGSHKSWSKKFGVRHSTFEKWVHVYETFGPEGLMGKSKASRYNADTKQSSVEAYLSGTGSQSEICKRFGILSRTQLQNWIGTVSHSDGLSTVSRTDLFIECQYLNTQSHEFESLLHSKSSIYRELCDYTGTERFARRKKFIFMVLVMSIYAVFR